MQKIAKSSGITLAAASCVVCLATGLLYVCSPARVHAAAAIAITTCTQLQAIDRNLGAAYVLANDVDCSDSASWNNGAGFSPIGLAESGTAFTGSLDGQGHTIVALSINRGNSSSAGLFYALQGATVQSVSFVGASVSGVSNAGTLAASADSSNLSAIYASGNTVTGTDSSSTHAGGLVGYASGGKIQASYSTGSVSGTGNVGGLVGSQQNGSGIVASYSHASVTASGDNAGGLVGLLGDEGHDAPYISDSYATGKVTSSADNVGGLAGQVLGNISDSFAASPVNAPSAAAAGGLVGRYNSGISTDNAYDAARSGQASCASGGACSTVMTDVTTINTGENPNDAYFFNSLANLPMLNWDSGLWSPKAHDFPVLNRPPHNVSQATTIASSNSIQISWPAANDDDTPDITGYIVKYRPTAPSNADWATIDNVPASGATISGLKPSTAYSILVITKTNAAISVGMSFDAKTTTPSAPPQITTHTHSSADSAASSSAVKAASAAVKNTAPADTPVTAASITIPYQGDFLRTGHTVRGLHVGDVVHFSIPGTGGNGHEAHTGTVKTIGVDNAVVTIASTPFDVRLSLGKATGVSVRQDTHVNLQLTLKAVTGGTVRINFRAIGAANPVASPPAKPAAIVQEQNHTLVWIGVVVLIVIFANINTRIQVQRARAEADLEEAEVEVELDMGAGTDVVTELDAATDAEAAVVTDMTEPPAEPMVDTPADPTAAPELTALSGFALLAHLKAEQSVPAPETASETTPTPAAKPKKAYKPKASAKTKKPTKKSRKPRANTKTK